MHARRLLIGILLLTIPTAALAESRELEKSLSAELKNKTVMLRGMYTGTHLHFDSKGNLLGSNSKGYWTSDATVEIRKVTFSKDHMLRIAGKRVITLFDQKVGQFRSYRTDSNLIVAIDIDPSWQDPAARLNPLLGEIFSTSASELASQVPDYWNCWLTGTIERREKKGWKCIPKGMSAPEVDPFEPDTYVPPMQRDAVLKKTERGTAYYCVGKGVTPPKPLKADDPSYTDLAKEAKMQGTTVLWLIVTEQGNVSDIHIQMPLGGGLDDKAIEAVRQWRFSPAMKDGQPVPVAINVEVNFRLY